MASESVLDLESLCAPVSEDQPAGPYWRDDEECSNQLFPAVDSAIRDARKNERKRLEISLFPEGSIERNRYEDPDWRAVIEAGKKLLVKTKDLWVASWVTEAAAREHGFAGLRDGLALLNQFCQNYWDHVHPRPDDSDGIRLTLAQMDGDIWAELIPLMPITKNGYSTADYDLSAEMEGLDSEGDRETYKSRGVISTADFESHIADSGPEFLTNLIEDVKATGETFEQLMNFLDEKCGHDAPASSQVNESFRQCHDLIRELAAPFLPDEVIDEIPSDEEPESEASPDQVGAAQQGTQAAWSREQAFKEIARQAELFDKYEPNSPIASILRQAIRLGKLSWRDLISGLTDERETLIQILRQTGVSDNLDEDED